MVKRVSVYVDESENGYGYAVFCNGRQIAETERETFEEAQKLMFSFSRDQDDDIEDC